MQRWPCDQLRYSWRIGHGAAVLTPEHEASIQGAMHHAPSTSTYRTTVKLAAYLGIIQMIAALVWRKPNRLRRDMASSDPDFESKATNITGLYLNCQAYAVVLCVNWTTHI